MASSTASAVEQSELGAINPTIRRVEDGGLKFV
jgi:hypothetical protein